MTRKVIKGKRIAILGMARSGKALAVLMKKLGSEVFLSEIRNNMELERDKQFLEASGIRCELGAHSDELLRADFIAVSPGIPLDIDILTRARSRGIPIFSEMEVASWFCNAPIIAVTGSNGKTTTTTLIGKMLADAGLACNVGGNIGIPFASFVDGTNPSGHVVLEVSSFQLEGIEGFRPKIAMILNFTPDHLDRYSTIEDYRIAKARIYENMGEGDYLILNADDPESSKFMPRPEVKILFFTNQANEKADAYVRSGNLMLKTDDGPKVVLAISDIGIPGPHNLANSAAAALAASLAGVTASQIGKTLRNFKGVEHRLERVAVINGVSYINDSKGTNVDAVVMALRCIATPIILIAGGKDKGGEFTVLNAEMKDKVRAMVLIGEAANKIAMQLAGAAPIHNAGTMGEAVEKAAHLAQKGDTVLLSPGCASFDMFRNFEHRGDVFKEEVNRLNNQEASV